MTDKRDKITQEVAEALANLLALPNLLTLNFDFRADVGCPPIVKYSVERAIVPQEEKDD